ncbi:hypothetical protein B4U80_14179 [Leptotrombidium deliense]|uniref:Ig-like domain-containing protein n=1 Tax=Leptotrombidium deliense TaxID=299467 RepID=A0A443S0U0_9ACAR|nr:hypothetical protein B4U80_14179 [Leptotrombidium deliense]
MRLALLCFCVSLTLSRECCKRVAKKKAPYFEEDYMKITANRNQKVTLSCKSFGWQPITYIWRRDINGTFIKLDVTGEQLSLTQVHNLSEKEDLFTCSAINIYGSELKYFKVIYCGLIDNVH